MSALPNLTKKFNSKLTVALFFAGTAAILQLVSIIGSIADSANRTKQLEAFERGSGAPPASSTAHAEVIFAVLQAVGLIGFGFALFTLVDNPFHLK